MNENVQYILVGCRESNNGQHNRVFKPENLAKLMNSFHLDSAPIHTSYLQRWNKVVYPVGEDDHGAYKRAYLTSGFMIATIEISYWNGYHLSQYSGEREAYETWECS